MAIYLKEQKGSISELFDMFYLENSGESWHFTFTAFDYNLQLKIHFLSTILFKKQTIRKERIGMCCKSKNIWTIRLELTQKGFNALMERSKKFELYLDVMFKNVDNLKSIIKLPYLSEEKQVYNIDIENMVGNCSLYFEKVQMKLIRKPKTKAIIIRLQERGEY
jgi:hypothetical protein